MSHLASRPTGVRAAFRRPFQALRRLHRDEVGDEGVNKILIIALIAVPLVIILVVFGGKIVEYFRGAENNLNSTSPIH
jgi:Flp pilus assembly pilin Flp